MRRLERSSLRRESKSIAVLMAAGRLAHSRYGIYMYPLMMSNEKLQPYLVQLICSNTPQDSRTSMAFGKSMSGLAFMLCARQFFPLYRTAQPS